MRTLYLIVAILLCTLPLASQDIRAKRVEYINRNQVDTPVISLNGVAGRAVDGDGVAVPNMRVALFTEKGHKFVAQVVTDENGFFRFGKIGKGNYRLVGRLEYDYLCPVNVRIRQVSSVKGSVGTKLVLQMRPSDIDDCSYGDTK